MSIVSAHAAHINAIAHLTSPHCPLIRRGRNGSSSTPRPSRRHGVGLLGTAMPDAFAHATHHAHCQLATGPLAVPPCQSPVSAPYSHTSTVPYWHTFIRRAGCYIGPSGTTAPPCSTPRSSGRHGRVPLGTAMSDAFAHATTYTPLTCPRSLPFTYALCVALAHAHLSRMYTNMPTSRTRARCRYISAAARSSCLE